MKGIIRTPSLMGANAKTSSSSRKKYKSFPSEEHGELRTVDTATLQYYPCKTETGQDKEKSSKRSPSYGLV